jgi:hypothetical protein
MPLANGSFSIRRIQLVVPSKTLNFEEIFEKIKQGRISPLDVDDTREHASGFCHPFSGEPIIQNPKSLMFDQGFLFGFRQDSKKIPSTLMKIHFRSTLKSLGMDSEELNFSSKESKTKLDQIKERLKTELVQHMLPFIKITEVLWFLDSHEVWIFSSSQSVIQEFEKLFFETFEYPYTLVNPGVQHLDFDRINRGQLETLEPYLDLAPLSLFKDQSLQPGNEPF